MGSIIDLGGTGLFGMEINQFCEHLEGVDLSGKMLDEARKNIYKKLIKQDILGYLLNANLDFDYFVSTDVFVYVGDLCDVFQLIKFEQSRWKVGFFRQKPMMVTVFFLNSLDVIRIQKST